MVSKARLENGISVPSKPVLFQPCWRRDLALKDESTVK
jgi:hypothetical protein